MAIIEVKNLCKTYRIHEKKEGLRGSIQGFFKRQYREVEAVKGISFIVKSGEIIGFIGANGAGKTTTLKLLSGLLYPTGGEVSVLGFAPAKRKKEYLQKISFVMGNRNQLWWDIPAMDSFLLNKEIYQIPDREFKERVAQLTQMLEVEELVRVPVRNLSLGQRMKMELVGALLHSPEVLYLDEPTIGLDMLAQKRLREFISEYNRAFGTTVILTSHYLEDIVSLANRIIMIEHGELVYDRKTNEITQPLEKEIESLFQMEVRR